jgi:hypothetical protein
MKNMGSGFTVASLLILAIIEAPPLYAEEGENAESWVDSRHQQFSNSADQLANWMDNFFGNPQTDLEAASSIIRIRPQYEWDERDGSDWKLRGTGRLLLPNVNKRLSLVFEGSDGDFDEEFYDPALTSDGDSSIGLQYQLRDKPRSKLYLIVATKSGPKGKLGARYRHLRPLGDRNRFMFSEELFWIGGDGFGTLTRGDIDHSLDDKTLLRWANKVEYSEESNGAEWNTRAAWVKRLGKRSALSVFSFIRGETDPEILKSRGFGVTYRHQFFRDWLYYEVEPRYSWRKRKPEVEREGVASIKLSLEITFGSGNKAK